MKPLLTSSMLILSLWCISSLLSQVRDGSTEYIIKKAFCAFHGVSTRCVDCLGSYMVESFTPPGNCWGKHDNWPDKVTEELLHHSNSQIRSSSSKHLTADVQKMENIIYHQTCQKRNELFIPPKVWTWA